MIKNIKKIQGDSGFLDRLKNLDAYFILSAGYTKTALIEGITVAGLPGFIEYTPALDMEVLYYGYPKSMPDIAKMPEGPPSPVLLAMAVKKLAPFSLSFIDTGLSVKPKCPSVVIDSKPSESILNGANIDSKKLYDEGKRYAKEIKNSNSFFILSECVPAGTTTAFAVTKALKVECDGYFSSSSFDKKTYSLKDEVVSSALKNNLYNENDVFDVLSKFGDTMQPFVAGLASELSKDRLVVLGGGTQMAALCAVIKKLDNGADFENIALMTTKWIFEDKNSNIAQLLKNIDPKINAFYADFDFKLSTFKNLNLYDEGFVKEGIGAGAIISYGYLKGVEKEAIVQGVEEIYRSFC